MHRSIQQRKPVIEPAIFWDQRYYIFCIIRMIFHQPLQADAECAALSHAISADVPQIKQPFHGKKQSPLSFFQVNPVQTEVLYNKALEYAGLTGDETVFDAYCGTGTITLFLSQKAKKVYGVEIIPQAIENANINAKENNVNNVEFFVGESEVVIPDLINKGIKADVVVVDPPRKGCDVKLLNAITNIDAKKIVYVSCDPSTLARDLAILEGNGYKTVRVQPVDMFPHTAHIETCVLLQRRTM